MAATQYLALLRGINVGGNNIIRMIDLKRCFEDMAFTDVTTYIQSGNVLFKSDIQDKTSLVKSIEIALSGTFNYKSRVVATTHAHLKEVVENAPPYFGKDADAYRYDVIFLKEPLTPAEAMKRISTKQGVDSADAGNGVIYFSRLTSMAAQSYLSKIVSLPLYQNMTIRNWNTTTKLLALMEKRAVV
jgi:uncharacterized protein (DUF1697 family)